MSTDKTLVIQSHRKPLPYSWLDQCQNSVKNWAELNHFDYVCLDDEIFDLIPSSLLSKTQSQIVIASDLARLRALQNYQKDYKTVIWCDADFLIFNPDQFILPHESYALGREVWVQTNDNQLKCYIKVHNAFMMFRQGNSFLDFYADTAENLLTNNTGSMPPQFIGPKLLSALNNIVQCPVMETAGMLSPLVITDIVSQHGPALDIFKQNSSCAIYAANLCASLAASGETSEKEIEKCIEVLLNNHNLFNKT